MIEALGKEKGVNEAATDNGLNPGLALKWRNGGAPAAPFTWLAERP